MINWFKSRPAPALVRNLAPRTTPRREPYLTPRAAPSATTIAAPALAAVPTLSGLAVDTPGVTLGVAPGTMRISPTALAGMSRAEASLVPQGQHPFIVAAPHPGVVPAGEYTMAQDSAIEDMYNYAISGAVSEGLVFPGYPYLAQLAQRPEYRMMAETFSRECLRRGIKVTASSNKNKVEVVAQVNKWLAKYKVMEVLREVVEHDCLFGRATIYIDTGDAENSDEMGTPLILSHHKITKYKLRRFVAMEPYWSYPSDYNSIDPLHKDFYQVSSWWVNKRRVHRTRLLSLVGREVPDILKPSYMFGGMSLSQMVKPYVDNWLRTRENVSDMIESFSTMVFSTDISATLNGGDGSDIRDRVNLYNLYRNNRGCFVVNKDTETLTNVSSPLGTLDRLQAQSQEHLASVSGIPLIKLLGVTPSGLNASSEGEIQSWYDTVEAYRSHLLLSALMNMLDIIQLSETGVIDPSIKVSFHSLEESSDNEKAALRKADGDTANNYIESGVITPEEERARLATEEGGVYNGLDLSVTPQPPPDDSGGIGTHPNNTPGKPPVSGAPDQRNDDPSIPNDTPSIRGLTAGDAAIEEPGDPDWDESKVKRDKIGQFAVSAANSTTNRAQLSQIMGHSKVVNCFVSAS